MPEPGVMNKAVVGGYPDGRRLCDGGKQGIVQRSGFMPAPGNHVGFKGIVRAALGQGRTAGKNQNPTQYGYGNHPSADLHIFTSSTGYSGNTGWRT